MQGWPFVHSAELLHSCASNGRSGWVLASSADRQVLPLATLWHQVCPEGGDRFVSSPQHTWPGVVQSDAPRQLKATARDAGQSAPCGTHAPVSYSSKQHVFARRSHACASDCVPQTGGPASGATSRPPASPGRESDSASMEKDVEPSMDKDVEASHVPPSPASSCDGAASASQTSSFPTIPLHAAATAMRGSIPCRSAPLTSDMPCNRRALASSP